MAHLVLFLMLSLAAMSLANPAVDTSGQGTSTSTVQEHPIVDFDPLMKAANDMQDNLNLLMHLLQKAQQDVLHHPPHVIHKRQTKISANVENGAGGPRGNVDISHTRGGTSVNGNFNFGRGGTGYGVGVNHRTNSGWNVGGNWGRQAGGGSSGRIDFGRSWNNGNTRFGGYFGRGGGGNSGGISFTHRFRK